MFSYVISNFDYGLLVLLDDITETKIFTELNFNRNLKIQS